MFYCMRDVLDNSNNSDLIARYKLQRVSSNFDAKDQQHASQELYDWMEAYFRSHANNEYIDCPFVIGLEDHTYNYSGFEPIISIYQNAQIEYDLEHEYTDEAGQLIIDTMLRAAFVVLMQELTKAMASVDYVFTELHVPGPTPVKVENIGVVAYGLLVGFACAGEPYVFHIDRNTQADSAWLLHHLPIPSDMPLLTRDEIVKSLLMAEDKSVRMLGVKLLGAPLDTSVEAVV